MGAPSHDEQVPPLDENATVNKAPANPPPTMEAHMRSILSQMVQVMTTQAQATKVQAQAMTTQANRDVAPCPHQQVTSIASHLREFTRMNPPTFYGPKVDEYPKEFM